MGNDGELVTAERVGWAVDTVRGYMPDGVRPFEVRHIASTWSSVIQMNRYGRTVSGLWADLKGKGVLHGRTRLHKAFRNGMPYDEVGWVADSSQMFQS